MKVIYARIARMRGWLGFAGAVILVAFSTFLVAYNPLQDQVNGGPVPVKWPNAKMTWSFNPTVGANVLPQEPSQVATELTAGSSTWTGSQVTLNGQTINSLTVARGQDQNITDPNVRDCLNVVSFSPSSTVKFPTGTIAFAEISTIISGSQAALFDADVVFNPAEKFTVTTPPAGDRFDVRAVAIHEFGHALGLDHSGIAHTVMYPFGDTTLSTQQRNLALDDVIGIAFLYPAPAFASATGTISGRITLNGNGVYASHVVAIETTSGAAVLDSLSNPDGTYKLVGVPPGTYNVLAVPLGADANSGVYTLDAFSGWTCGFAENAPPCCDPAKPGCTGVRIQNPTNYTGKFF